MSRPTVFSEPAARVFNADDRPVRHKSVIHLVTESTFLSNDQDFSRCRPFQMAKTAARKTQPEPLYHLDRNQSPESYQRPASVRRALPQSVNKLSSTVDLTWSYHSPPVPRQLCKQAEVMLQGKLLLREDLPIPETRVARSKQERVGLYMNSHLMKSSLRHRGAGQGSEDL